jgi:tRNA-specific 2-thiouridylase
MSGGVDSAVAAALLVEAGHDVVALHLKLAETPAGAASCCGLDAALDAAAVADRLGIPFYAFDVRDSFRAAVVDDLVAERLAGRTPIPCVLCNGVVKFPELLQRATALGCSALATGHYARLLPVDGKPALHVAADAARDQSYFLWSVDPSCWDRVIFPLGDLEKSAVRATAARHGLPVADKPDSQELCFVPDGDHAAFVRRARPDLPADGTVHLDGAPVAPHDAYYRFTPGQRRGTRVAAGTPAWVERIDAADRSVHLTTDPRRLLSDRFEARGAVWQAPLEVDGLEVRVRHRGRRTPCVVMATEPITCQLSVPERAITPGQSAVWYRGGQVVGGARISRAISA